MQDGEIGIGLGQKDRLRDFELQPSRRQARLRQRRDHDLHEVAAAELRRRQIDRDLDVARPFDGLCAGFAQHPLPQLGDEADVLGDRNEFRRRDHGRQAGRAEDLATNCAGNPRQLRFQAIGAIHLQIVAFPGLAQVHKRESGGMSSSPPTGRRGTESARQGPPRPGQGAAQRDAPPKKVAPEKEKAGPWESPACPCRPSDPGMKVYPHPSPARGQTV